jgi:hypothetical protein
MTGVLTRQELAPAYGAEVQDGLGRASEALGASRFGAALEAGRPAIERAIFRLSGLALSGWVAVGMPNAASWPLQPGPLSMGDAVALVSFCTAEAPLLPTSRLPAPAAGRLQMVVQHVATTLRELDPARARSPRLDLAGLVVSAPPASRRGVKLGAALGGGFVRLRNLESHHAGRAQPWVAEHPDYAELFAPLLIAAALEILRHSEVVAPLAGLCVAEVVDVSPRGRDRVPLITLAPDATGLQRAFARDAAGLGGVVAGQLLVVRIDGDPSKARPVMHFVDVAQGAPRHPTTGELLP